MGRAPVRAEVGRTGMDRGVTLRSIVFGLCLVIGVGLLANTVRYILHASYMAYSHMPMGNLILSLFSITLFAALARLFGRAFVFSPSEWITIFSMGFIGSVGPTYGVSGYLIGVIVSPYYFATPENRWAEYLHPHLPRWIIPPNEDGAMTLFFDGLPPGAALPWGAWVLPLFWWFLLICAVGLACFCASIILHRQWSEHERLVYPAMEPVLEITMRAGTGRRLLPDFVAGRTFWAGFGVVGFIFGWNIISWFYPAFPKFPTAAPTWVSLGRDFPKHFVFVSTFVICFSYFASLEVLFSLWFFDLVFIVEAGILNRLGIHAINPGSKGAGRYAWQTTGAFVALAVWWLLTARHHLRDALRKAIHPNSSHLDDGRELLSYRTAFVGLAIGSLFALAWFWQAGIEISVVLVLILAMYLVYFTVAKILADSGLIYVNAPTNAWSLTTAVFGGAAALPASTHAVTYPVSILVNHYRGVTFSTGTHVNRLGDFVTAGKRRFFAGTYGAFVVGVVFSTLFTLWLGYRVGGYNFDPNWLITRSGTYGYRAAVSNMVSPEPMLRVDYWFFLAGAGVMAILTTMRYRFPWWPFHPIGLALSGTALARLTSTTMFVAWLTKFLLIKLGGASFYRKSRPFFVGALVAYILATAAGVTIDALCFGRQGHFVHKWY